MTKSISSSLSAATICLLASAGGLEAQGRDTVVVPGPQYGVSDARERLFGDDYRDLWTTPLRVPFLDLGTYAGGLRVLERGGGLQTSSLRFAGSDGRQYVFRSVDKRPDLTRDPALVGTLIADVIQDQTSSLHPGGPLVVPVLAAAIGVPHVAPALYVMPDDPRLGEFRADFARTLGFVEERPEDPEDGGAPFGTFGRIIGTDRLMERIEESAEDQVDARTYLTARFLDLLIGDWDRHADQWRWGEMERGGVRYWVPIPRDRDYAFVDYDGVVMEIGRNFVPNAVTFGPTIDNLAGLSLNSRGLDRLFLAELDRAAWDSTAAFVRSRLTDALIDDAVLRIPTEFGQETRTFVAGRLKSRRDSLGEAARNYYLRLSSEVDVRGTDEADLALVDRSADDVVDVRFFDLDSEGRPRAEPYYQRRFKHDETFEVRLHLQGEDDRVLVRGSVDESIMVRVVGGGGDDVMADSSVNGGATKTAFYDGRGDNQMIRGAGTAVDNEEWEAPDAGGGFSGETYRDWGASYSITPTIGWNGIDGPVIGGGPTYTRYGFRKYPYAYRLSSSGAIGLQTGEVEVSVGGDFRNTASRGGYTFLLSGSELDPLRFYGFGNETESTESGRFYQVRQDRLIGQAAIEFGLPAGGMLAVGPIVKYSMYTIPNGTPFERENPYGKDFGQAGGLVSVEYDLRDNASFPTRGARLQLDGATYAPVWDAEGTFGRAQGTGSAYWTPTMAGWAPTLAVWAGGAKVWGDFPVHEAAFLGGRRSLRGYRSQRFAGDAMVFGSAEARAPLGNYNLGLVRSDLGVLASYDAGRVFMESEDSNEIHTAVGGGVWMRFNVRNSVIGLTASYAQGQEGGRAYLAFGAPF